MPCSARLLFETLRVHAPDTYRTPPGVAPDRLADYYLAQLERVLAEHHQRIAAMVIEPLVQCAAGMVMHPRGYLRGVRELTRKYNVLLIADEVAVGFGRTGKMFACEHEDVSPDFLCLAKGLTGGYLPMAATLTTDEIWHAFLGRLLREQDLLPRATPMAATRWRGRSPGFARRVRGGTDPPAAAGEDCAPRRTPRPHRTVAVRGRRATVAG